MRIKVLAPGMLLVTSLVALPNGSSAEQTLKNPPMKGDAAQGKAVFNGKGICHYCHGIDGVIDRKPPLTPDTAAVIARLAAAPPDLRNRAMLKLKDNKARFRVIRDGHPGSGMFPDTTMTDQDITDVLAYLATLRHSAPARGRSPY